MKSETSIGSFKSASCEIISEWNSTELEFKEVSSPVIVHWRFKNVPQITSLLLLKKVLKTHDFMNLLSNLILFRPPAQQNNIKLCSLKVTHPAGTLPRQNHKSKAQVFTSKVHVSFSEGKIQSSKISLTKSQKNS